MVHTNSRDPDLVTLTTRLALPVLILCLLCLTPRPVTADNLDPAHQVVRLLIDLLQAHPDAPPATGAADVSIQIGPDVEQRHVDFRFQNSLTRSDCYLGDDTGRQSLLCTWALYPGGALEWTGHLLCLTPRPAQKFYRRLAYDFHPHTFTKTPLADLPPGPDFEQLLDAEDLRTALSSAGILEINASCKGDSQTVYAAFDTTRGYRLIDWKTERTDPDNPQTTHSVSYHAQWKDYGTPEKPFYYITEAAYDADDTHIHIEITRLEPGARLPEIDFTPAGLKIPPGTKVLDEISGLSYAFGQSNPKTIPLRSLTKRPNSRTRPPSYRTYLLIALPPLIIPAVLIIISIRLKRRSLRHYR